ncbi:MAG: BamA/OMP85 family outer membrane protein, partial [Planctomycetia bacterium]
RGVRPNGFNPSGVGDMGGPTPPRAFPQGLPIGDPASLGAAPGELPTNLDVADPVVADVQVVGNRIIPAGRILSKIKTHPGRPYQPLVVKTDVRTLFATNWFYDVSTETQGPPENPVVVYRVVERPVIQKVEYRGNTVFREKDLREATGLQAGKAMDPGMNSIRSSEIERKYREKGYPFAKVELLEGGGKDDVNVVFKITEGPKTKILSTRVEGNTFVSNARLKTKLGSGPGVRLGWGDYNLIQIGGKFDSEKIEEDVAGLIEYYRTNGYLDVKVGRRLDWTQDRDGVHVVFVVDEGPRYSVSDVKFVGNQVFNREQLTKDLKLTGGTTFNQPAWNRDQQVVKDAYGRQGYTNVVVNSQYEYRDEPGKVTLVYQVQEDVPRKVGEVKIIGNEVTKDSVIRGRMEIQPGEIADTTKLRLSEQRLRETRLFKVDPASDVVPKVEFDPANDPSAEFQDVIVRLEEVPTGSLMFGVGVNSDSGVGGSLVVDERNFDLFRLPTSFSDMFSGRAFRGAGQELRLEAVPGNQVSRYAVTFREPRLLGLDYSLSASGYYFSRFYDVYDEQRTGGTFSLGKRFTRTIGGSLGYRIENVDIENRVSNPPDDVTDVLGGNFINSLRVGLDHDTRDSHLQPSKGHFLEGSYEQVFGDFNYPELRLSVRQFFTLTERADGSGKQIITARGEVAYAGDDMPIFERFYGG